MSQGSESPMLVKYLNCKTFFHLREWSTSDQEHYIAQLRKCAERSPIAPIGQISASCTYVSLMSGYGNLDNLCRDPMNNNKDCQVGQLTRSLPLYPVLIDVGPEKSTLRHITENLPLKLRENYASCVSQLLSEAAEEYEVGWSLALDVTPSNLLAEN